MYKLGLDRPIENKESRLRLVGETFGFDSDQYRQAAEFIMLGEEHGFENLIKKGKNGLYSRSTFYRRKEILDQAGAWLVTGKRRSLPPLRLVRSLPRVITTNEESPVIHMAETA